MKIKDGSAYLPQVLALMKEYTQRLGRDLSFQNFDAERKDPAEKYTPPHGALLVAVNEKDEVLGMVAYHRHSPTRCEMKRLYVRPQARGLHLGETLAAAIIARAQADGFSEMVLDTIRPLQAAISLYQKLGFKECAPYYNNPMPDVIYMKKSLQEETR